MQSTPRKQRESGVFREVWKAYNSLVEYCREIAPQQSGNRGIRVSRTSNGTLFLVEGDTRHSEVKQFRVKSASEDDHLVCRGFDGTTEESADVNVAKPHELRKTGWDGVTITYTLESVLGTTAAVTYAYQTATYRIASGTEHQGIRPFYVANQTVILATRATTGVDDAPGWIDLNLGGRAWAKIA